MSGRIVISYANSDAELGLRIVQFLQATLGGEVSGSSLPGHVPEGGDDSLAALKQRLASADVVVGVITARALASGEVPFQLGAAWSLGTRLVLLLGPDGSESELYLPMGHAETLVLGPEALIELANSLGAPAMTFGDLAPAAREALSALFPDFHSLDRESSERPVARPSANSGTTQQIWPVEAPDEPRTEPEPAPPQTLAPPAATARLAPPPSCSASLHAGRAISDCVFHRDPGGRFAAELDLPFGAFLGALGTDWNALRKLEDLDLWLEVAENVLASLPPELHHVGAFYEMGYQVATLINLAHMVGEHDTAAAGDLADAWRDAFAALREAASSVPAATATIEDLQPLLENLYGPQPPRDAANLGRVQERVRELALMADAAVMAVSA